jgi:predicted NBD/HSP70 family sugar kinase
MADFRFGIDLGGTKIEIVALDADGRELLRRRIPTPKDDYEATACGVCRLVEEGERELGGRARWASDAGIASRATGLLRGSNSVCLNGRPIRHDLEALLGREIRITNDANCFALSKRRTGRGRAPPSSTA